ncbi:helix-turn-helix domain-containing protein [Nonomuraea lactucae]|uniref:AraC-like ligand-binding domain-containing protein n=1 Tax=Nonomuraea lactucae TaxID=2249762 RepID=UPI000DE21392|nr:helix-turn-helix domain-containing protein [Nonomuraea lactucae]
MSLLLDTASVSVSDKVTYWNDAVARALVPMRVTPRDAGSFSGTISTDRCGYLQVSTIEAEPETVRRTPELITRTTPELIAVGVQAAGRATLTQDARTAEMTPGDLVLYDTTRPYILDHPERARIHILQLPRRILAVPDQDLRQLVATAIRPHDGLAAMVSPFLCRLATSAGGYPAKVGERLGGHVRDLLATLITDRTAPPADDGIDRAADAFVRRIRLYVNQHLADPGLSPERIAAAHRISVRYLYKLWAGEDTTLSRWIQQRRLEECGRELSHRGGVTQTISAVAQRWGFVNAAHFSGAFRAVYGMSPSDWRNKERHMST